jgi:hypothetical protein
MTFSAYDISDANLATLQAAGYSDDAILEIIDAVGRHFTTRHVSIPLYSMT